MAQAQRGNTDLATLQRHNIEISNNFARQLEDYTPQLMQALPAGVSPDRFKRVLITAVATNPDLLYVDRRSLFMSAAKCAVDGLLPDGRQAVLLPFNTDVKLRDPNTGLDRKVRMELAQYIPMVHGIRDRMRRTGEVLKAEAEVVYRNDHFRYRKGDDGFIEHEPPALDADRGDLIGAYAIIHLKNGERIREVMNKAAIEKVRTQSSKQPNGPLWRDHYEEACRKTVLRLASKQAPQTGEDRDAVDRMLDRDDEPPELPAGATSEAEPEPVPPPPPPRRPAPPPPDEPEFAVIDLEGVESIYRNGARAAAVLRELLAQAAQHDVARLEGAWESNQQTVEALARSGFPDEAVELATEYERVRQELSAPPPPASNRVGPPAPRQAPETEGKPRPGLSGAGRGRPASHAAAGRRKL